MCTKAFIILLLAVAQPAVAAEQGQTKFQKETAKPLAQSRAQPNASVEVKSVDHAGNAASLPGKNGAPAESSAKITDWMQALTSLAILAVIIVQACIYHKQRKLMQRQLLAMRRGLGQTRNIIKATNESVEIARRSLRIGTRAYVTIHSIEADLKARRIFIAFENIGRVPAENLKIFLEMATSIPKVRKWFTTKLDRNYGVNSLSPGNFKAEFGIEIEQYLTTAEISLVSKQEGFLTVFGYAEYDDGFETGQRSHFALTYYAKDNKWSPHPVWSEDDSKTDDQKPN